MTKDREIVLMLILRKRLAHRLWANYAENLATQFVDVGERIPESYARHLEFLHGEWVEAHNAAECARCILYGIED